MCNLSELPLVSAGRCFTTISFLLQCEARISYCTVQMCHKSSFVNCGDYIELVTQQNNEYNVFVRCFSCMEYS